MIFTRTKLRMTEERECWKNRERVIQEIEDNRKRLELGIEGWEKDLMEKTNHGTAGGEFVKRISALCFLYCCCCCWRARSPIFVYNLSATTVKRILLGLPHHERPFIPASISHLFLLPVDHLRMRPIRLSPMWILSVVSQEARLWSGWKEKRRN